MVISWIHGEIYNQPFIYIFPFFLYSYNSLVNIYKLVNVCIRCYYRDISIANHVFSPYLTD